MYRTTRDTRPDTSGGILVLTKLEVNSNNTSNNLGEFNSFADKQSKALKDHLVSVNTSITINNQNHTKSSNDDLELQTEPMEVITVNIDNAPAKAMIKFLPQSRDGDVVKPLKSWEKTAQNSSSKKLLDNGHQKEHINLQFQMAASTPILKIGISNSVQRLLVTFY